MPQTNASHFSWHAPHMDPCAVCCITAVAFLLLPNAVLLQSGAAPVATQSQLLLLLAAAQVLVSARQTTFVVSATARSWDHPSTKHHVWCCQQCCSFSWLHFWSALLPPKQPHLIRVHQSTAPPAATGPRSLLWLSSTQLLPAGVGALAPHLVRPPLMPQQPQPHLNCFPAQPPLSLPETPAVARCQQVHHHQQHRVRSLLRSPLPIQPSALTPSSRSRSSRKQLGGALCHRLIRSWCVRP
jgi:hypothetical protein